MRVECKGAEFIGNKQTDSLTHKHTDTQLYILLIIIITNLLLQMIWILSVSLSVTLSVLTAVRLILTVIAIEPRSGKSLTYFVVGDGVEHLGDFPGSGHRIDDWTWTGRSIDFHHWNHLLWHELRMLHTTMKKRSERRKYCALVVVRRSQKFSPRRRPPSRGRVTAKI